VTMNTLLLVTTIFSVCFLGLWFAWAPQLGLIRGLFASACRIGWLAPLAFAMFAKQKSEELPRTMAATPVHVLVDDSPSMAGKSGRSPETDSALDVLEKECVRLGCAPRISRLSELSSEVARGYSPIAEVFDSWLLKVASDPWVVMTDGGDWRPAVPWQGKLSGAGKGSAAPRGLILGRSPDDLANVWIAKTDVAPFSFDGKPLSARVELRRTQGDMLERVQVQVLTQDRSLATANAEFRAGEKSVLIDIPVPPLSRGQHLLQINAIPTAREKHLWDNRAATSVEVVPNTVGVLHLLGSPSWDGRFMRRYLKAEPKYDIISFFILRDPFDSQQVSERELSLIPFPVERLFREELPNFRVIIMQNFTMVQFLQPEYQAALVKFVQNGGGLLFVGGPRALQVPDLASSPLRAILPFETSVPESNFPVGMMEDAPPQTPGDGLSWDPNLKFSIELARPEPQLRALANVYDDWERLGEGLTAARGLKGLHRMDRTRFKPEGSTPLLTARTADGAAVPLAVASYPGKGRAIWIFSDSLWRLAMGGQETLSRQTWHRFAEGAMTWLMRQDLKQPLVANELQIRPGRSGELNWRVELRGPATRYFRPGPDWKVAICGMSPPLDTMTVDKGGADIWAISGTLNTTLRSGDPCTFTLEGTHEAFGSVRASTAALVPETLTDEEVGRVPWKLESLAQITGARLVLPPEDSSAALTRWIEENSRSDGVALPSRFKVVEDHYWILEKFWWWLLLVLMPLEVLVRRWHVLFASA
jgi:hypothetical protein